ncbi:MAG TPA: DUF2339 domain-containing protein, partial [Gemmatimonadales bacterium]|nr:DUF2339 domain-containing protein [Gemmatimonadales bacterium]
MTADERLDRLERRLRDLEEMVLDLRASVESRGPAPAPAARLPATAPLTRKPLVAPSAPPRTGAAAPSGIAPPPARPEALSSPSSAPRLGAEEWIGQRGLLAAGVFLLILAAGYFLKLAFDRGWISPLVRCAGGAVFGSGVMVMGWRLRQRGLGTYGAAVMGAGAAIVYLAAWAAARLYELIPATVGMGMLAVVSIGVFALAWLIEIEALALAATVGAFLAPVLLGWQGNPDALLLYSAFLAAGMGWFAWRRWRLTTFLITLSFFALGAAVERGGVAALLYAVAGSAAALHIGLVRQWKETRVAAFWAGWLLLVSQGLGSELGAPVALGGLLLAAPIFWHAWRTRAVAPESGSTNVTAETLQFYVTPLWLGATVPTVDPAWFNSHDGSLPLVIGLPYLAAGYAQPRIPFAMVGTTALGFAVLAAWPGLGAVWGLLALVLVYAGLDHRLQRTDGRWYALAWVGV